MVLISLTDSHLEMNQREDTEEVEEEHFRPEQGSYVIDGYDLFVRHIHMLFDISRSKQIFKCDYLLCEKIYHATKLLK